MKRRSGSEPLGLQERYHHNREQHDHLISERDALVNNSPTSDRGHPALMNKIALLEAKIERLEELMYFAEENAELNLVKAKTRPVNRLLVKPDMLAVNDTDIPTRQPAKVEQIFKHDVKLEKSRSETKKKIDLFATKKRAVENEISIYTEFLKHNSEASPTLITENKELLQDAIEQRKMYSELLTEAESELQKLDAKS